MTCSKLGFAFWRRSAARPGLKKVRLHLEMLENRLQPSLTGLALDGIEAHPLPESESVGFVAHSIVADGFKDLLSVSSATYITGTAGSATARGAALGQDGSTYQAGTITVNGSETPHPPSTTPPGKQSFLVPFHLPVTNQNPLATEANGSPWIGPQTITS